MSRYCRSRLEVASAAEGGAMAQDVRADLIADLTYLRKATGLTPARLAQAGAVVDRIGGGEQPIETLHERLLAALRSIDDTEAGKALWAACGLDPRFTGGLVNDALFGWPALVLRSVHVCWGPYDVL
jgi:hypothetical protein